MAPYFASPRLITAMAQSAIFVEPASELVPWCHKPPCWRALGGICSVSRPRFSRLLPVAIRGQTWGLALLMEGDWIKESAEGLNEEGVGMCLLTYDPVKEFLLSLFS
ncbi:hypothetical protein E2C01_034054 [Portunus trituberculatus]|uniref:Uncharacterized protein n=1 Tax=Portunus trituberculatus TaxID=210409 RepID=A0A5B7F5X3_PORTR|nr:hypothetical protein [Portunus trituberculatus]